MIDDIGLGRAIANALYLIIGLFGAATFLFLIGNQRKGYAFWWLSAILNLFCGLIFMGDPTPFGSLFEIFSLTIWPVANLGGLIYLFINSFKRGKKNNANEKKENIKIKKIIFILAGLTMIVALVLLIGFCCLIYRVVHCL